jgi:hypothetical protein
VCSSDLVWQVRFPYLDEETILVEVVANMGLIAWSWFSYRSIHVEFVVDEESLW